MTFLHSCSISKNISQLFCYFVWFQDLATPVQIAEINNAKTEKKMTGVLTCVLFERSVLAVSSVTGKSKEGRQALDPQKVQLIIGRFVFHLLFVNNILGNLSAILQLNTRS